MTSIREFQVTFDCAAPERVARFWCEVLGYVIPPPPKGFATWDAYNASLPPEDRNSWSACIDPSGTGPRLYFQRVPEGSCSEEVTIPLRGCLQTRGRDATRLTPYAG